MYENTTFQEYLNLLFQGFRNIIQLNIDNGDYIDLAQCRTLATISTIYTTRETFDAMSDTELKHYAQLSLPENRELLDDKFREIITEPYAKDMVDTTINTIGNQHQFSLDLMMHRHTLKKLAEVNKMTKGLAAEKSIQLLH